MMKYFLRVKYLLRIHNYPRYFTDYVIVKCLKIYWKQQNILIGKSTNFLGIPIISKCEDSEIIIGNNCLLCSSLSQTALGVSHKIIFRTLKPYSTIRIGDNVRMSGTTVCSALMIQIGDNCVIGSDVIISDTDFHSLDKVMRNSPRDFEYANDGPVHIGNNVFIGTRCIILKGVTIGDNSIIGAGSIVTKNFAANSIIAGNPAKLVSYSK